MPSKLRPDTLYVVGQPAQWAMFLCPCGAGHDIALSLGDRGAWRLETTRRDRLPTVHPSVDAVDGGRRCHYWIRRGVVVWVADPPEAQPHRL